MYAIQKHIPWIGLGDVAGPIVRDPMVRDGDIWGHCTDYPDWGLLHHATFPVVLLILVVVVLGEIFKATNTGQNYYIYLQRIKTYYD